MLYFTFGTLYDSRRIFIQYINMFTVIMEDQSVIDYIFLSLSLFLHVIKMEAKGDLLKLAE